MDTAPQRRASLELILRREWVLSVFQPLVSVKHRDVVGLEALSRGLVPGEGLVPPSDLFRRAREEKREMSLEYLCQRRALEHFARIHSADPDLLLFLNYDVSLLDKDPLGPVDLAMRVGKLGMDPGGVAVEVKESRVENLAALREFVGSCRKEGFLIALDDVGAGHSNLDRVPELRPDILKVDLCIVRGIERDFYRREVFRSLVTLSRNLGALVVAEGVETQAEADVVLELGADLLQGNFLGAPRDASRLKLAECRQRVEDVAGNFKNRMIGRVANKRVRFGVCHEIANHIIMELYRTSFGSFDAKLRQMADQYANLECLYLLNEKGIQVSEMVYGSPGSGKRRHRLFQPLPRGSDHSLREYYYLLMDAGLQKYLTEPYISFVTGRPCVTLSVLFRKPDDEKFILCMDIRLDDPESL